MSIQLTRSNGCLIRCCRHLAASEGSWSVAEWLLENGADINVVDRFKRTPLEVRSNVVQCGQDGQDTERIAPWDLTICSACQHASEARNRHVRRAIGIYSMRCRAPSGPSAGCGAIWSNDCCVVYTSLHGKTAINADLQDAVRGDFNDLAKLLIDKGALVYADDKVCPMRLLL